jgi:hypothetical protein
MGRPKGSKNKGSSKGYNDHKATKSKNPGVEDTVEVEIEFDCPVRGKVKQKVKVKKLKTVEVNVGAIVNSSDDIDALDAKDNELPLYGSDTED